MSPTAHADREHAHWSASATARHVACVGSLTLESLVPDGEETIHAARGTAAHTIAERCLNGTADASDFLGEIVKTKKFEIEIDEELVNSAQTFVDYVRGRLAEYEAAAGGESAMLLVEQKFSLAAIDPPYEAGGTGDAVMYFPIWRLLEIADLKNGVGYVSEKNNPQLRSYGLGALLANRGLDVTHVRSTIVQPRIGGNPVREETIHVADLVEWTADLRASMLKSKQAETEYAVAKDNSVLFDEWVDKWLTPGNCKFCKREATCPANAKAAQAVAEIWFDDMDQPRIGNLPGDMSPEKLAQTLDMLDMLESWAKAVRAYGHAQAEQGVQIPGYQLVDKISNRKWADDTTALTALINAGLTEDQVYTRKPVSPAQAEKALGAKRKALIEPFVTREITGTNLVSAAKTSRPAAKTVADKYFEA